MPESRNYNSEYYDAITTQTNDIEFYKAFVTPDTSILELGCGTGRVALGLSNFSSRIVGVDISAEMITCARSKDNLSQITFLKDDITEIQLNEKFDLIIAPFRVMQALELDEKVAGLFRVIRTHLKQNGIAILNVFKPLYTKEEMASNWIRNYETAYDDIVLSNGDILKSCDTRKSLDLEKQVLHPEIIHRRFRHGTLIGEHVNPICMRYYYPDQFKNLIIDNGFQIINSWGGYGGEKYGEGPELVVAFQ